MKRHRESGRSWRGELYRILEENLVDGVLFLGGEKAQNRCPLRDLDHTRAFVVVVGMRSFEPFDMRLSKRVVILLKIFYHLAKFLFLSPNTPTIHLFFFYFLNES